MVSAQPTYHGIQDTARSHLAADVGGWVRFFYSLQADGRYMKLLGLPGRQPPTFAHDGGPHPPLPPFAARPPCLGSPLVTRICDT